MHAAHKTLPFGTVVTVTNLDNGASVTVTINDRGPFVDGRIIDLCDGAFAQIAPLGQGVANVRITW
jgi:rare lipoprotein A